MPVNAPMLPKETRCAAQCSAVAVGLRVHVPGSQASLALLTHQVTDRPQRCAQGFHSTAHTGVMMMLTEMCTTAAFKHVPNAAARRHFWWGFAFQKPAALPITA